RPVRKVRGLERDSCEVLTATSDDASACGQVSRAWPAVPKRGLYACYVARLQNGKRWAGVRRHSLMGPRHPAVVAACALASVHARSQPMQRLVTPFFGLGLQSISKGGPASRGGEAVQARRR